MRLTPSDLVVLSTLLQAGPMHGYDLSQRLTASDVEDWAPVSKPEIYYSLKKLAAGGYLKTGAGDSPSKGPDRIVYTPTARAKPALREALARKDWVSRDPPAPFTTWLALALSADPDTIRRQIDLRDEILAQEMTRERATLAKLEELSGRDVALGRAMVRMALARMGAERDHLQDLKAALLDAEDPSLG